LQPDAALAALHVYQAESLAFLSPTPSDLVVAQGLAETLAAAVSTQAVAGVAADLLAGELGAERVGLLQGGRVPDEALASALQAELAARGVEVQVARRWAAGLFEADALFIAASVRDGGPWIAEARAAGYTSPIVGGPELHSPLLSPLAEGAASGVVVLSGLAPVPDSDRWQEAFRQVSGGPDAGPLGWWAYSAAYRLLDALDWDIRQAQGPTRPGVLAQVAATPCSHDVVYRYRLNEVGQFEPP
jgi:ABC-type branched-subunit amino acid transport system substrate-binding protein